MSLYLVYRARYTVTDDDICTGCSKDMYFCECSESCRWNTQVVFDRLLLLEKMVHKVDKPLFILLLGEYIDLCLDIVIPAHAKLEIMIFV